MFRDKKVFIFDLDGTLSESKRPVDSEMAKLIAGLTRGRSVAIIGGGKLPVFKKQLLIPLSKTRANLDDLYLFPTNGAAFYRHKKGWRPVYRKTLSMADIRRVLMSFKSLGISGRVLENRKTQITYSALGQRAPLPLKKKWNRTSDDRPRIVGKLKRLLPGFEIRIGGLTSIDVTKKGIDKGYAIIRFLKSFRFRKNEAIFFGDAIFPGGNDYSAKKAGIRCVKVSGPNELKKILRKTLKTQ